MKKKEKNVTQTVAFIKKDLFDITIPFKKRSNALTTDYTYFNTTANKIETANFYDYYKHLKGFGFRWENDLVKY